MDINQPVLTRTRIRECYDDPEPRMRQGLSLPESLHGRLRDIAFDTGTSMSELIIRSVRDHLGEPAASAAGIASEPRRRVMCYIPADLHEELHALAHRSRLSLNRIVIAWLRADYDDCDPTSGIWNTAS